MCYALSMDLKLPDFIEGIKTPIKKLSVSELRAREAVWRSLWSWTPEEVQQFLLKIGTTVRVMKRNYQGIIGELGQVKFEPKSIEIRVYEKSYDYNTGKYFWEDKVLVIPYPMIGWVEGIITREEVELEPEPEVSPIPDEELSS